MPELAAGFGRYGGFLLESPRQLEEAVIGRLSVVVHASGHCGQLVGLFQEPAAFAVRLR